MNKLKDMPNGKERKQSKVLKFPYSNIRIQRGRCSGKKWYQKQMQFMFLFLEWFFGCDREFLDKVFPMEGEIFAGLFSKKNSSVNSKVLKYTYC
jgi:hypothetical protein